LKGAKKSREGFHALSSAVGLTLTTAPPTSVQLQKELDLRLLFCSYLELSVWSTDWIGAERGIPAPFYW